MRLDLSEIETLLVNHAHGAADTARAQRAGLEAQATALKAVEDGAVAEALAAIARAHPDVRVTQHALAKFDPSTKRIYLEWPADPPAAPVAQPEPDEAAPKPLRIVGA